MSPNSKRNTQEASPVSRKRQRDLDSYTEPSDAVILKWAGKDATETFEPIHPPDTLNKSVSPTVIPCLQSSIEEKLKYGQVS